MEKKAKVTQIEARKIQSVEKTRVDFKQLILKNPNYFDTFPELKVKAVAPMLANTKYEQLTCVGFYPERDVLEATFQIKLPYGYGGNLCSPGSYEYVRFFVDWNGDGDFSDKGDDVGMVSVNVHDIPDGSHVCVDKAKPISYAVTVKINPQKKPCFIPNLVKVRAILSWELPPTAGKPDFHPPWGNVVDKWIQIKPCKLLLKDVVKVADLEKLKLTPQMLDLDVEVSKEPKLTVEELKQLYSSEKLPAHRVNFEEVYQIAQKIKQNPALMVQFKINPQIYDLLGSVEPVLVENPSTRFEELTCVGLHYDLDTLVATLVMKLPTGYSGGLCTQGSFEYVAFWAYVHDPIENTCYWKYLGTSNVAVHDIKDMPKGGLNYAVFLPYDFSAYKDKCSKPKLLKIRAILSWNTPPSIYNPNYNPVWGNKVDAVIHLKPPIMPGKQIPFISVVGGMAIESISGNALTTQSSTIGDGYANGPSVSGGFSGLESPFGREIAICGHISNPPNDPAPGSKLKYKVQYRKLFEPNWHDIANKFKIWISKWNGVFWTMSSQDQISDSGYYTYEEDLTPPYQRFVEGDTLAWWITPVPEGDGVYEVRVLLYKPGEPASPGVPADHVVSNIVMVRIDNTLPDCAISLDVGACAKIKVGDSITGEFTATDEHISDYSIAIEPATTNPPTWLTPNSEAYPAMSAPGRTNWPFEIQTTNSTTPCGYVLHLHVWDRTIINNSRPGNHKDATVGLCLLEKGNQPDKSSS